MRDDDGAGLVLPVGDGHAVVIAAEGVSLDGLGKVRAELAPGALAAVAAAAGLVAEGVTLPARLGGRLVELDAQSAALLKAARQATEPGGWVQGNLRQANGEYAHVARFRAASVLDVAALSQVVSAVAAQAQLAAIHRDVVRTLHQVEQVSSFQHAELLGSLLSLTADVRRTWDVLARGDGSARAVDSADRAGERLREKREHCVVLAAGAVAGLEAAAACKTPVKVLRALEGAGAGGRVPEYLGLAVAAHCAAVEAEALVVAGMLGEGDPAAAAHAEALVLLAVQSSSELDGLRRRAGAATSLVEEGFADRKGHFGRAFGRAAGATGVSALAGGTAAASTSAIAAGAVVGAASVAGPVAVLGAAAAGVSSMRQAGAQARLVPLLDATRDSYAALGAALERVDALVSTVADAAGLDPDLVAGARRGPGRRSAPTVLDLVLTALGGLQGWSTLGDVRRASGLAPLPLVRALDAAVARGSVEARPDPDRPLRSGRPSTLYRFPTGV